MEFSREGNNIIRCVISEEEIEELGYTIDDIISNGARTQQFMNQIFDLAEQEFNTKFELGIKSVRADIMPDHTISLTFSEHPGTEGVMDHIKDIVNGLLNTIPKQKWDEIKAIKDSGDNITESKQDKTLKIIVLFAFEELDTLMRYAKQVKVENIPFNQLYKFDGIYFLMMDMTDSKEEDVKKLSALTDEYAADIFVGAEKRAFIYEHGKEILHEQAIEQLRII
ncbi:MAG: adaptor protein MecA [Agathobacter sp.]|nr:adaptor protein MecA [Agathobacter sp.]